MNFINLAQQPNQQLTVTLNDTDYQIKFQDIGGITAFSWFVGDSSIIEGYRCMPNDFIVRFKFLTQTYGDFYFVSVDPDDYPVYTDFNDAHILYYIAPNELATFDAEILPFISF